MPGETEATVAGAAGTETTADQQAKTVDVAPKAEGGSEEPTKSPLEQLDIKEIVKKDDGTLEWTIEDEAGDKSTFTGKTLGELMSNVSKRLKESNGLARKLKASEIRGMRPTSKSGGDADEMPETLATADHVLEPPDENQIRDNVFAKAKLDPRMAYWNNAQWRALAEEKELRDFEVTEIKRAVEKLNERAETIYSEQSKSFLNETMLNRATENVESMLAESGLEESKYVELYHKILNEVWADKRNFDNGTLIAGKVELAMHKAIRAIDIPRQKSKVEEEIARKIAEGKERKAPVKTGGGATKDFKPTEREAPKSYLEASRRAQADLAAGKYDR